MEATTWLNTFNGVSAGTFDSLTLRTAEGNYTDLLELLGTGAGISEVTGEGAVSIVSEGTQRKVVVDLSDYATTAALAGKIDTTHEANKIGAADVDMGSHGLFTNRVTFESGVGDGTPLAWLENDETGKLVIGGPNSASGGVITIPVLTDELANYTTTTALTTLLDAKQPTISATLPLVKTGTTLSTLWKPSEVSVGAGLFALSNDSLGTLNLVATGTESRDAVILRDPNTILRQISSNITGELLWDGAAVSLAAAVTGGFNAVTAELAFKEDNLGLYAEGPGSNSLIAEYFDDDPTTPTHVTWASGTFANAASSHQEITMSSGNIGVWGSWFGVGVGTIYASLELKAGSVDHCVFAIN